MLRQRDLVLRNTHLRQPLGRQVDAPDLRILDDIAGNVGQLKGQAQITGAIQRRLRLGAHHPRHHQAHDAGNAVAVQQGVVEGLVAVALHIHAKTRQVLQRMGLGNPVPLDHLLEGGERRIGHRLASVGALGEVDQLGQPRLTAVAIALDLAMPQRLAVDHIVAMTAPGVEHHRALAGALVEQLCRGGEALGADIDRLSGVIDDLIVHPACPFNMKSSSISPAVALAEPTTPGTPAPG